MESVQTREEAIPRKGDFVRRERGAGDLPRGFGRLETGVEEPGGSAPATGGDEECQARAVRGPERLPKLMDRSDRPLLAE